MSRIFLALVLSTAACTPQDGDLSSETSAASSVDGTSIRETEDPRSTPTFATSRSRSRDDLPAHPVRLPPEVWYAPPTVWMGRELTDENHAFFYADQFATALDAADVYIHHVQTEASQSARQRTRMLTELRDRDVALGVVVAGLSPSACSTALVECRTAWSDPRLTSDSPECARFFDQIGTRSALETIEDLAELDATSESLGYEGLSVLVMDGPLKRTLDHGEGPDGWDNACNFGVEHALDQAFQYMDVVASAHPQVRFDWMVNFLNWDYTMPDGTLMHSVRGPGNALAGGFNARVLADQIARRNTTAGHDLSISVEGGAEWYEGEVTSPLWPAGVRADWLGRTLAFRAQIERLGIPYNQGFSAVNNPCAGITDPREHEQCEVDRDTWLREVLMTHLANYKRRAIAEGLAPSPELATFVQWNGVPRNLIPERDPESFAGWFLEGKDRL